MKQLKWAAGILLSIAIIFIMLITSFEIGLYVDKGFNEREYMKYDVMSDLDMELADVIQVTDEMMDYLYGKRDDLEVHTTVAGEEREFFNDREKAHMVDVKNLFTGGKTGRIIAIAAAVLCIAFLVVKKTDWKRIISRSFQITTLFFFGLIAAAGIAVSVDFTGFFTKFHEIFFSNDLWLLDPRTDLMINMLPEGFFFDTAIRIGGIFLVMMIIGLAASSLYIRKDNKKN